MVSRSYEKAMTNIYIDGAMDVIHYWTNYEKTELISTNRDYDIGLDRNASSSLHGYLRDLFIFNVVSWDDGLTMQSLKGKHLYTRFTL